MYDIKNRRKFLSRTAMSDIPEKLFIGTKLNIHSRQHTIVAYGDDKTETVGTQSIYVNLKVSFQDHSGLNEAILFVFPESKWSAVGNVLNNVYRNGLKITNVKSLHLNKDCAEVVGFEGRALAMAVQGNTRFKDQLHIFCYLARK